MNAKPRSCVPLYSFGRYTSRMSPWLRVNARRSSSAVVFCAIFRTSRLCGTGRSPPRPRDRSRPRSPPRRGLRSRRSLERERERPRPRSRPASRPRPPSRSRPASRSLERERCCTRLGGDRRALRLRLRLGEWLRGISTGGFLQRAQQEKDRYTVRIRGPSSKQPPAETQGKAPLNGRETRRRQGEPKKGNANFPLSRDAKKSALFA